MTSIREIIIDNSTKIMFIPHIYQVGKDEVENMILDPSSLVKTIDNINEHLLFEKDIPQAERFEAAKWLISQQGKKGSYRGMSAPSPQDFEQGIRVFTGEALQSASARHIMGQEAARAAWLLGNEDQTIKAIYTEATHWMRDNPEFKQSGTFCCGRCTLAYWRHFWVGDFENKEALMSKGLRALNNARSGDGKWQRIPFYYAIYTLMDIELEPAKAELRYARPNMQKYLKNIRTGLYSERRGMIMQKALEQVD